MSDKSRLKATVYVGGLDLGVTSETLHAAFVPFGDIADISLPKPEQQSSKEPHRGFGYVEFEVAEDAKEAIDNMNQSELYGRVIKVAPAKPQKDHNEGLGSRTAIWEQVCCELAIFFLQYYEYGRYLQGSEVMQIDGHDLKMGVIIAIGWRFL
jgi:RNA recognition motif-containing protein